MKHLRAANSDFSLLVCSSVLLRTRCCCWCCCHGNPRRQVGWSEDRTDQVVLRLQFLRVAEGHQLVL